MRVGPVVIIALPFVLTGCPVLLSDWSIAANSDAVDASADAKDSQAAGGSSGSGEGGSGGSSGSRGGSSSSGSPNSSGGSRGAAGSGGSSSGGSADASASGGAASGGSGGGASCLTDLSGVGTGDFSIRFMLTTTESALTLALLSQRTGCDETSTYWDVSLNPTGGTVAVTNDGTHRVVVEAGNSLNDGEPHVVDVIRRDGMLWYASDGMVHSTPTPDPYSFGTFPPLVIGSSACAGTSSVAGHAVISDVCLTSGDAPGSGAVDACAPITHDNGQGQTWQDCAPLGTYDLSQAMKACKASGASECRTTNCGVGDLVVCGYAAAPQTYVYGCWGYSGEFVGRAKEGSDACSAFTATWD